MPFTPPNPKPNANEYQWATYIPGRSEKTFKVHRTIGHAHAAISRQARWKTVNEMTLYKLVDDEWVVLEHFPVGTTERDLSWKKFIEPDEKAKATLQIRRIATAVRPYLHDLPIEVRKVVEVGLNRIEREALDKLREL